VLSEASSTDPKAATTTLLSIGAEIFLLRLRACELQVERKYVNYQRARAHLNDIDYDLQAAHAYCHVPNPMKLDNGAYAPQFVPRKPWDTTAISSSYDQEPDHEIVSKMVVENYAGLYELLSFCQNIATSNWDLPNTKRPLCAGGSPASAVTTFGFTLFATGGLANTLKVIAALLSATSSCGGGGGGGGNQNQNQNQSSSQNAVTGSSAKGH
jgi:hypothetical protein